MLDFFKTIRTPLLVILDMAVVIIAVRLVSSTDINILSYYTGPLIFTMSILILIFYMFDLYDFKRLKAMGETFIRTTVAVVVSYTILGALYFTLNHWYFPQKIFFLQTLLTASGVIGIRLVMGYMMQKFNLNGERVIIIGAGKPGQLMAAIVDAQVVGFIDDDSKLWTEPTDEPFIAGPVSRAQQIIDSAQVKKVIFAIGEQEDNTLLAELVELRTRGIIIEDMLSLYERKLKKIPIHYIHNRWLLLENGFNLYRNNIIRPKRVCDLFIAVTAFILLLPVMIIVAIAVIIESPGGFIFAQKRIGLGEKKIVVYKFRSMRCDSEVNGAQWAQNNDPRITRVGAFMRKFRIDELPQLWNVIKGDMSIIGPRPEQVDFVRELEHKLPFYYLRHTVKPGITGWAQIMYPYGATIEDAKEKLEYELYYIKNMSLFLDLKILLKTVGVIIFGQGAR